MAPSCSTPPSLLLGVDARAAVPPPRRGRSPPRRGCSRRRPSSSPWPFPSSPWLLASPSLLLAVPVPVLDMVARAAVPPLLAIATKTSHGRPDLGNHHQDTLPQPNLRPPGCPLLRRGRSMCSKRMLSVLALGPLTNVALAIKKDPSFASKVKKIVVLGGSFFAAGNATPSAEANIRSDPEAADIVFTSGADIYVVGLNITTQVRFTGACSCVTYASSTEIGMSMVFLHDPVSFAALVRPEYFTFKKGVVRVETKGICTGHTSMDMGLKKWNSENPWTGYSPISVAWTVDVRKVVAFVKELVTKQ
ncbi:hypothetical protein EJB05_49203, partial [Eragrostis curvula]